MTMLNASESPSLSLIPADRYRGIVLTLWKAIFINNEHLSLSPHLSFLLLRLKTTETETAYMLELQPCGKQPSTLKIRI